MNLVIVPARNDLPWYSFKVTLGGAIYTLSFRYNGRMQRWILDVADAADGQILSGLPLLILRDLKGRFVISGLPEGLMFVAPATSESVQPTRLSFGVDHILYYEELNA